MFESKKIGEALSRVHVKMAAKDGIHILHTSELSRGDREILLGAGWLQEIIKGWYLLTRPDVRPGDSSSWYANFWEFLSVYLCHFYGKKYCLSAENSLALHVGMTVVPKQVIVIAPKGRGAPIPLPFDTSLLIYATSEPLPKERVVLQKLQAMSLPYALCKVSPYFFQRHPQEAEIALQSILSSDDLLQMIIPHHFVRAAGRLVGAYRFLRNQKIVEELLQAFSSVHLKIQEENPFVHERPLLEGLSKPSPYVARIEAMWEQYRQDVIDHFPTPPDTPLDKKKYLHHVDQEYPQDAYHSLSIEGYQVDKRLIEKVKEAQWAPDIDHKDRQQRDALAARGYYEAFLSVKETLISVFSGKKSPEKRLKKIFRNGIDISFLLL